MPTGFPCNVQAGSPVGIRYGCVARSGPQRQVGAVPDEAEKEGRRIAIETRGEGGYAVVPGSLHPSGRRYEALAGDFANIPTVPQAVADALLAAARKLDEAPFTRQQLEAKEKAASTSTKYRNESNGQGSIIDAYNERATIGEALDRYGYTRMGERYVRPGGKSGSVTVRDGRSFHHSSNDALNDGYWHRPFDLYCQCEHGGEIKAAVKAAAEHLGLRHLPSSGQSMEEKTQPKTIDYHPLTCAQLIAAKFEIRFLVESIMAAGQPCVVAAHQKALKTSTSL